MKKAISHIAIYLLTATVLFTSTGVSVHHFYCQCLGKMTASIFKPGDPCEMKNLPDCCKSQLPDEVKTCDGKKDCSDCTSEYVHLDSDYLLFSADYKLSASHFLPPAKYFAEHIIVFEKPAPTWENDLPPPPFGKSLLPHIQSFLC